MEITRENIDTLNKALIETLKEFAEKHGLVLQSSGCSYNENTLTKRVSFKVKGEDGSAVVSEQEILNADLMAKVEKIPFKGHIIGTLIEYEGVTYKIAGLIPRARTNNWMIVATIPGGKKYRVSGDWLKKHMK